MSGPVFFGYFFFLLLFFPLLLGGNRPPFVLLAVLFVAVVAWLSNRDLPVPAEGDQRSKGIGLLFAGLWLPVVWSVVQALPVFPRTDGYCPQLLPSAANATDQLLASGCAISLDPWSSLQVAALYGSYCVAFAIGLNVRLRRHRATQILALVATYLVVALVVPPLLGLGQTGSNGLSGTFVNPNHFAAFTLLLLFLALYAMCVRVRFGTGQHGESGWQQVIPIIVVPLALLAILLSGSRSALLGLLVGGALALPVARALQPFRQRLLPLLGVMAMLVVVLLFFGVGGFGTLLEEGLASTRYQMWKTSLPILWEWPLTGIGAGAFMYVYPWYKTFGSEMTVVDHPHNELLEALVELGVVVPALSLLLLVAGFYRLFGKVSLAEMTNCQSSRSVWLLLAGLLALGIQALFDFSTRIPAIGLLAYTMLGLVVGRVAYSRAAE